MLTCNRSDLKSFAVRSAVAVSRFESVPAVKATRYAHVVCMDEVYDFVTINRTETMAPNVTSCFCVAAELCLQFVSTTDVALAAHLAPGAG